MTFGGRIHMAESVVLLDTAATPKEPADSSSANNKLNKLVSPDQLPKPPIPKLPEHAWTSTENSSADEWLSSQKLWMQHEHPSAPAHPATIYIPADIRNPQDIATPAQPIAPPNLSTLSPFVSKHQSSSSSHWLRYDEPLCAEKMYTDPVTCYTRLLPALPDCMRSISPCIDGFHMEEEVYTPSWCSPCTMVNPTHDHTSLLSHSSLIAPQQVDSDKYCCSKLEAGVQTEEYLHEDNGLEILSCIAGCSSSILAVSESKKGLNGLDMILQAASYLVLEEHLSTSKMSASPPKSEYHIESSEPAAASPPSRSPDLDKNYNVVKNFDKGCRRDSMHPSLSQSGPVLIMNASELKTRLEMADVQLKYKEKQRELAKIPRSRKKRLKFSKHGRRSKSSSGSLLYQSKLSPASNPRSNIFGSKPSVNSGLVSESNSVPTTEAVVFNISHKNQKFSSMSDDVFLPGPRSGASRLDEISVNSENVFLPKRTIHSGKLSSNSSVFSDSILSSKSVSILSNPNSSKEIVSSSVNLSVVSKKLPPFDKSASSKAFGQLDNVAQLVCQPDLILSSATSERSNTAVPLKSSFHINNAAISKSSSGGESAAPSKSSFGIESAALSKPSFGNDIVAPLESSFGSDSAAPLKYLFGSGSTISLKSSFDSNSAPLLKYYFDTDSAVTSKSSLTLDKTNKGVPSKSKDSKSYSVSISPLKSLIEPSQSLHIISAADATSSPVVTDYVPSTMSSAFGKMNSQSLCHSSKGPFKVSPEETCFYEECKSNGSQLQTKYLATDDKSHNFSFCSTFNLSSQISVGSESSINCNAVSSPFKYTFSNNHPSHERLSCWTSSSETNNNKRNSPQTADAQQIRSFSEDASWKTSAQKRLKLEQEPSSFHELACLVAQPPPNGNSCKQISQKSPKALHKAGHPKGVLYQDKNGKAQIKDGIHSKNLLMEGVKEICRRSERVFLKDSSPRITVTARAALPSCLIQSLREDLAILFFNEGHFYESIVTEIAAPEVYGVKVKGECDTKSHIMSCEALLDQAIQDVRVSSETLLAAETRVCAYWSRKINCLYPAKVATDMNGDGHVLLQFDDGDSSRISLQDIRLIPQNWPTIDYNKISTPELKGRRRKKRDSCHKLKSDHHNVESGGSGTCVKESNIDVCCSLESQLKGKDFKDDNTIETGYNGLTKKSAKEQIVKARVEENSETIESSISIQNLCVPRPETKEINCESKIDVQEKICGRVKSPCKEKIAKVQHKINNKATICCKGRSPDKEKVANIKKLLSKKKDRDKDTLSGVEETVIDVKYSENGIIGMSKNVKGIERRQREKLMPKLHCHSKNLVGNSYSEKLKLTRNLSKQNKSIIFSSKLDLERSHSRQNSASSFVISSCLSDAAQSIKSGKGGIVKVESKSSHDKSAGQQNALLRVPTDLKKVCDGSPKQILATILNTEVSACTRGNTQNLVQPPPLKHDCHRQHLDLIEDDAAEKQNCSLSSPKSRGKGTKVKNDALSRKRAKSNKKKEKQNESCKIVTVDDDCNNDVNDVEDGNDIEDNINDDNGGDNDDDDDSESSEKVLKQSWLWFGSCTKRQGSKGCIKKRFYKSIVRDGQVVSIGDCAVFLSADRADLPYVGRIESFWEGWGGSMHVRVSWFYHPEEMCASERLAKPQGALYQSMHMDDNDVQTISHKCQVISFLKYCKLDAEGAAVDGKVYYLAGHYDPLATRVTYKKNVVIHDAIVDKDIATG